MQKIAICHITVSPGGVEAFIRNVINYSNSQVFKHTVVCYKLGNYDTLAADSDANVVMIPMVREISPFKDLSSLIKIYFYLKKHKPDLIHAHSAKGGIFGRICGHLLGIPVVFTPHAFSYLGQQGVKNKVTLMIERKLALLNHLILPSSNSEKDRAVYDVMYKDHKILDVYYNSIQISIDPKQGEHDKRNKPVNVLSLSRFSFQKNPELMIDAIKLVSEVVKEGDVVFHLVGAGFLDELGDKVERLIDQYKIANYIKIYPWKSSAEIESMLSNVDIFLMTSRFEGLPTVLLMAMNKFLPIVATNVDGVKDVVEHNVCGILGDTPEELADGIIKLIKDPMMRSEMGARGNAILKEKFNIEKNIKYLEEVYQKYSLRSQVKNTVSVNTN